LDRVNIGQAAVAGLKGDLGILEGNAYAIALSVFFIGNFSVSVHGTHAYQRQAISSLKFPVTLF
jgi:hypothetical protein